MSAAAAAPRAADLVRWEDADRTARPERLARLRARMVAEGVDAYFGVRPEHMRYLTGFRLDDGEEKVAGHSGQFLVAAEDLVVLADSRYTIKAARQASAARVEPIASDLAVAWSSLVASVGARRIAVEAGFVSYALWERLASAAPDVELVAASGWIERDRVVKEPAELERVAAACGVADRALDSLLPAIRPGVTERELAWQLEVLIRRPGSGAEALAFDVAALFGPEAALPHGAPGDRPIAPGSVLLFDFGAQVAGYRSDMTRTLFVGEPSARDLAVYETVARAQAAAVAVLESVVRGERPVPTGREIDAVARGVIEADGRWAAYGHGLGHGIGLATHEAPSLGRSAASDAPLPSPTVFSVEPGIYLDGEMGVRIEDLVLFDAGGDGRPGRLEQLTNFPRGVLIVG
ncbi:MAG: aminopeptidase P family protein [Chloroflexi bacterium]|nr:aminopeptidase P family protein [Chloroflexota bacterium]